MLSYFMSPLDMHIDRGFGAVADSFQDAAEALEAEFGRHRINGHLPVCYLYRHAIELYLKASIIIIHRGMKLPYGDKPFDGEPYFLHESKWISIYSEHQIQRLYNYLCKLLFDNKAYLENHTNTNWTFPGELEEKIREIQSIDSSSGFFRYPVSKNTTQDRQKSGYKRTSIEEIMAQALKEKRPMKTSMTIELGGRAKEVYAYDDSFTHDALAILREVARMLGGCHIALIHEVGGGGLIRP